MEGLIVMFLVVGTLAFLGLFAQRHGVDSRATNLDDWARPVFN